MSLFVNEICLKLPKYWSPSAWTEHVPFAFWIVDALKPRVYVELGAYYGMSYFAACQIVAEKQLGTRCYAVDTWNGDEHSGFYSEEVFRHVDEHNHLNYSDFSNLLRMRFDQALDHIPDGSVDLLHVDGRHFYDDVKVDFESWIPKLSERAVVMFHDTEVRESGFGVWKLWSELENHFPSFNFLHGHGLGVIAFGPKIDPSLTEFFAMSSSREAMASFRHIFMSCGKNLSDQWERRVQRAADEQRLAALQGELEKRQGEFAALQSELSAEQGNRSELTALIADLRVQLSRTRGKPLMVAGDYLQYRLLRRILKLGLPLSAKTAARFANSAAKRNPQRSFLSTSQFPAPLTPPAVTASPAQHLAEMTSSKLGRPVDASKKTIMVVSHEASRTGAPILAWNLVNELSKKYNVVSLILGGGELRDDFLSAGVALFEANRRVMDATEISAIVDDLCNQHDITFALVNSVESRSVLPALKSRGVPSICLLHEFACNIRPVTAFADVFSHADQVVFSTRVTLENALHQLRMERNASIHLIPQGKCLVPTRNEDPAAASNERLWLDKILRPGGEENREFVVLGAGALEMRKGLDLFVECANRVININGGGRFRFVWIGNGYEPATDTIISVFLADQIKRAGIEAQVKITRATSEIEHAYANADLLLLPSRLDPLPNVAIDALIAGIPVVCFDRTTGIADFLIENGLGDACVARYLDTTDLSRKVHALASNDEMRADVVKRGQHAAVAAFDFANYVARIDEIASRMLSFAEQADQDMQAILASEAFRADFYLPADQEFKSEKELVANYLNSNRLCGVVRKPMPGFHPSLYAAHHDAQAGPDPLVRFMRDGKPAGPWSYRVVDNSRAVQSGDGVGLRTAIHLHVFYPETLPDILSRLARNAAAPDLFVSAPKSIAESLQDIFSGYRGKIVDIRAVPNRGRDIAPLLTTFGRTLVAEYDVIGHFHTKKSPHVADRKMVEIWTNFLLENLIGGQKGGPMLDRILAEMSLEPKIGIAYPDDPQVMSWTENRGAAENLALRMGLGMIPEQFNFPMGNMFWIRSSLLTRFVDLDLTWDDYPAEPLPIDGTILHAIERLFGIVPGLDGKTTLVTNVRGVSR
jgi:glycosyltransferase involved in cell wall biosynthesis